MGLIKCHTHGLQSIIECCGHIGDAITEESNIEARILIGTKWGIRYVFCPACEQTGLTGMKYLTDADLDGPINESRTVIEPYCWECAVDWSSRILKRDLARETKSAQAQRSKSQTDKLGK